MSTVAGLQTLLERVQRRAAEPRARGPVVVPVAVAAARAPRVSPSSESEPAASEPFSSSPIPFARRDRTITRQLQRVRKDIPIPIPAPSAVEEIEEYDEELIEIIDENEAAAPAISPALQPDAPLGGASGPPVSEKPIVTGANEAAALTPELVARGVTAPGAVVQTVGQRLPLETTQFVDLLDLSLSLGA